MMATATALAIAGMAATTGGTVASAALSSRANNRASKAQQSAADKALAFEKERDAANRAERDRYAAESRRAYEAQERIRMGLLKRYGMNVGSGGGGQPMTLGTMAGPRTQAVAPQSAPPAMPMAPPMPMGAVPTTTRQGLAGLADWSGYERSR